MPVVYIAGVAIGNCKQCNGTGRRRCDICGGTGEIEAIGGRNTAPSNGITRDERLRSNSDSFATLTAICSALCGVYLGSRSPPALSVTSLVQHEAREQVSKEP